MTRDSIFKTKMQWEEVFNLMSLKSLRDTEHLGYNIFPSVSYEGGCLTKKITWYAGYKGKRISSDGTKRNAKQACINHYNNKILENK